MDLHREQKVPVFMLERIFGIYECREQTGSNGESSCDDALTDQVAQLVFSSLSDSVALHVVPAAWPGNTTSTVSKARLSSRCRNLAR